MFPWHYIRVDGLGDAFSRSGFLSVSVRWFPGEAMTRVACVEFVTVEPLDTESEHHGHKVTTEGISL